MSEFILNPVDVTLLTQQSADVCVPRVTEYGAAENALVNVTDDPEEADPQFSFKPFGNVV